MPENESKLTKELRRQVGNVVRKAKNDDTPIGVVVRALRDEHSATATVDFAAAVAPLLPDINVVDWVELKRLMEEPMAGPVQLGKARQAAYAALAADDQEAFWTALLLGMRMLRKHASTVSFS